LIDFVAVLKSKIPLARRVLRDLIFTYSHRSPRQIETNDDPLRRTTALFPFLRENGQIRCVDMRTSIALQEVDLIVGA
jgi:hypothetical protein